jgi:iron complex outermembrane receptor protein
MATQNNHRGVICVAFFIVLFLPGVIVSAGSEIKSENLLEMSLEELMEINVTSSGRRLQDINRASRAMYVITAEDIRNSGVTNLGELLRLVPGVHVGEVDGSRHFTGIRGFSSHARQRMQYLMDGRPLYGIMFGGFDQPWQPIDFDNIERIEVIRGNGGVIWGVNAVNGVVNIITKKAADTQGTRLYGGVGNRERYETFNRYGGTSGQMAYRIVGGYFNDNGQGAGHGDNYQDFYRANMVTGRADITLKNGSQLFFTGGHLHGKMEVDGTTSAYTRDYDFHNLIWSKQIDEDRSVQFRWSETYYDMLSEERREREDMLEAQYNVKIGLHEIVCGADYMRDVSEYYKKNLVGSSTGICLSEYTPAYFANDQVSAYIEDEITLADNLWLTLGHRSYYSELTHYDWAGSTSLVHEVSPGHFLRASVSKAFKRPSFEEEFRDRRLFYDLSSTYYEIPARLLRAGNRKLRNEKVISYELGYRGELAKDFNLNIETFVNNHYDLIGTVASSEPYTRIRRSDGTVHSTGTYTRYTAFNVMDTTTYGTEVSFDWKPVKWWLIRPSYSYIHQTNENRLNNSDSNLNVYSSPQHQFKMTNRFNLDGKTTLNTQLYWTDKYYNTLSERVDPYWRLDVHLARRFWNDNAEIAVGVTNLTDHFHSENSGSSDRSEVPRLFYTQFSLNF